MKYVSFLIAATLLAQDPQVILLRDNEPVKVTLRGMRIDWAERTLSVPPPNSTAPKPEPLPTPVPDPPPQGDAYNHYTQYAPVGTPPAAIELPTWTPKRIVRVPAGADLQAALNAAQRGDELVLDNAEWIGNYVVPAKAEAGWIMVRSDALTDGRRQPSSGAATVTTPNSGAALSFAPNASGWIIRGLEIHTAASVAQNYVLVSAGSGTAKTYDGMVADTVFDRLYVHGTPNCDCKRGFELQGTRQAIIDSLVDDIHIVGQDTQAILGWNGPGPYLIQNNYLAAAGENIMFGGADPARRSTFTVAAATTTSATFSSVFPYFPGTWIMMTLDGKTGQDSWRKVLDVKGATITFDALAAAPAPGSAAYVSVIPSDITIRDNYITKPLSWNPNHPSYAGKHWSEKNTFELKCAQRLLLDHNLIENTWLDGQNGNSILIKTANQDGATPACQTRDITVSNNFTRNTNNGVGIVGHESYNIQANQPAAVARVTFRNNLFMDTNRAVSLYHQPIDTTFERNTILTYYSLWATQRDQGPIRGLTIRGNLLERAAYGIGYEDVGSDGTAAMQAMTQGFPLIWDSNTIINGSYRNDQARTDETLAAQYGSPVIRGKDDPANNKDWFTRDFYVGILAVTSGAGADLTKLPLGMKP